MNLASPMQTATSTVQPPRHPRHEIFHKAPLLMAPIVNHKQIDKHEPNGLCNMEIGHGFVVYHRSYIKSQTLAAAEKPRCGGRSQILRPQKQIANCNSCRLIQCIADESFNHNFVGKTQSTCIFRLCSAFGVVGSFLFSRLRAIRNLY